MRLKSTLWALAFACAAMSCSDDLENGPGNKNDNEKKGETALINVVISTTPVTKTANGDDNEVGTKDESTVKNVMVILYQNEDLANNGYKVLSDSRIKAIGYTTDVSAPSTGGVSKHDWYTSVEVKVTDEEPDVLAGEKFGVITVANAGDLSEQINALSDKTLGELGDILISNVQTDGTDFIMSTHTIAENDAGGLTESTITLQSNATEGNIPSVNVYVERLAAKIRIGATNESGVTDFTYPVMNNNGEGSEKLAEVVLNSVAVVNQLNSGTYLLKRVTENNYSTKKDLEETTSTPNTDTYLGDETANTTNFVIDPWTRIKRLAEGKFPDPMPSAGDKSLSYTQFFTGNNFSNMYESFTKTTLNGAEAGKFDNGDKVTLCYTQENTSSIEGSRQGFSTGAIFKATYYPTKWMAINDQDQVVEETVDYNADTKETKDFYLYKGVIYKNREAIFAGIVQKMGDTQFTWANIKNGISKEQKEAFLASKLALEKGPFGYVDHVVQCLNNDQEPQTFSMYIQDKDKSVNIGRVNTVLFYEKGECYYRYWIRHANNNNASEIGVMEFGIVRNNIYDLAVTKINKLGLSGDEKPDPTDPTESDEFMFNVALYVKNWTLRSNESIIF